MKNKEKQKMKYTNKKVLMRVEFNVPLTKSGKISDDTRIRAVIPSIKDILKDKPKQLILMFHLGRPKNRDKIFETTVVAGHLATLLKRKVTKVNHCGELSLPDNYKIVVLENLRFYEGEKLGSAKFSKQLASLADVYVNESFGTCHRKDASMFVVPKYFDKNKRVMGPLVKTEIKKLGLVNRSTSLTTIVGFAKISDKIHLLDKLLKESKQMLMGGLVIFTFLKAQGLSVGTTKVLPAEVQIANRLINTHGSKIILPVDFRGRDASGKLITVPFDKIPRGFTGLDIGPKSIKLFSAALESSKVVFWNGPLGYFEKKPFDKGTNEIIKVLAMRSSKTKSIVGGGDTVSAVKKSGLAGKFYHISTGGGASLALIDKGTLPALKWFK